MPRQTKSPVKNNNEPKRSVGRPVAEINKTLFEDLCRLQCTKSEIATVLHCCEDTISNYCYETYNDNFSNVYKMLSEEGKISLRRSQFRIAETNSAMAIFLGKQYLGQKDYIEQETISKIEVVNDIPQSDDE